MTLTRTRLHLGATLLAIVIGSTGLAAQQLTLPDWMHSSARDLPREVFPTQAQTQTAAPTPSPPADTRYPDEPYVIEQVHTRVRFENDGTSRREVEARVRVQSEAGLQRWGQIVFGYNTANEKLDLDTIEVHKASGEVVKATADNVQDLAVPMLREAPVYSDFRQRHVSVPSLRPGDTLSYHVTYTTQTALVPGQFWFVYDFDRDAIVLDESVTLDLPAGRDVVLKVRPGIDPVSPAPASPSGRAIHAWHGSHLVREKKEQPKSADAVARALRKLLDRAPADVQLTTFRSWDDVARWYADLARPQTAIDDAIKAKAAELTRGKTTPLEKLEALSDYVAQNVRYVSLSFGLSRYQPHRAGEVLANQYGDCKDKHTLLASLASAAGLEVMPVLANSRRKIDPDVPSPGQFDHVISVMPTGKDRADWIWTDTTATVAPFRRLSPLLRGKTLLLATTTTSTPKGEGVAHSTALIEVPKRVPIAGLETITVTGSVSELGKLDMHVTVNERSDGEVVLRNAFLAVPRARWSTAGEYISRSGWIGGTVSDLTVSDPLATHEPFRVEFQRVREGYVVWENGRSRMPVPIDRLAIPSGSDEDWQDEETYDLPEAETHVHVQLTMPASVTMQVPVDVTLTRDYAEYSSTYKVDGQTLTLDRTLRWKMRELPMSRRADYQSFVHALRADEDQRFGLELKGGSPSSLAPTANASAHDLFEAARAAFRGSRYAESVALYTRVVELEPKHTNAWNNLGLAQLALDRVDEAEQSFRRQIEINAFDQYAYNNLGQALRRQHKWDEAEAAFRKQLEINPLDQYANRSLGAMASERHQYPEARVAFEKAVGIAPNDAGLRIALGDVYLHLKMDAEAAAAFDKAVQLSPTPPTWNSIAYAFAQNDVHLDRAQQYAESAASGSATALRQASLQTLTPAQLRVVVSLAASWDTLGWVSFKRGDLAAAERYVRASWLLVPHAEVGDHLAQLLEKQGKASDAISVYAQALAAKNPPEETRGRLDALLKATKGAPPVDAVLARGKTDLTARRTLAVPRPSASGGDDAVKLPMLILLDSTSKTAEVKFMGADAKAGEPFAEALRTLTYPVLWPDSAPTKVVRRGELRCAAGTGACELILDNPEDVRTLDPEPR